MKTSKMLLIFALAVVLMVPVFTQARMQRVPLRQHLNPGDMFVLLNNGGATVMRFDGVNNADSAIQLTNMATNSQLSAGFSSSKGMINFNGFEHKFKVFGDGSILVDLNGDGDIRNDRLPVRIVE